MNVIGSVVSFPQIYRQDRSSERPTTLSSEQKEMVSKIYNYLDPNLVDPNTYTVRTDLSFSQKMFMQWVRFYKYFTKGKGANTWFGRLMLSQTREDPCVFIELGHLSHADYAVVAVSELGLIPGLKAYHARKYSFDFRNNKDALLIHQARVHDYTKPYFVPVWV